MIGLFHVQGSSLPITGILCVSDFTMLRNCVDLTFAICWYRVVMPGQTARCNTSKMSLRLMQAETVNDKYRCICVQSTLSGGSLIARASKLAIMR